VVVLVNVHVSKVHVIVVLDLHHLRVQRRNVQTIVRVQVCAWKVANVRVIVDLVVMIAVSQRVVIQSVTGTGSVKQEDVIVKPTFSDLVARMIALLL